jgi:hypothetical protein
MRRLLALSTFVLALGAFAPVAAADDKDDQEAIPHLLEFRFGLGANYAVAIAGPYQAYAGPLLAPQFRWISPSGWGLELRGLASANLAIQSPPGETDDPSCGGGWGSLSYCASDQDHLSALGGEIGVVRAWTLGENGRWSVELVLSAGLSVRYFFSSMERWDSFAALGPYADVHFSIRSHAFAMDFGLSSEILASAGTSAEAQVVFASVTPTIRFGRSWELF